MSTLAAATLNANVNEINQLCTEVGVRLQVAIEQSDSVSSGHLHDTTSIFGVLSL